MDRRRGGRGAQMTRTARTARIALADKSDRGTNSALGAVLAVETDPAEWESRKRPDVGQERPMPNTQVKFVLRCIECAAESDGELDGWRAYLLEDELDVLVYCPECGT